MLSRHRVSLGIAALLAPVVLFLPASARQSRPAASALAPLELVAQGLGHLRGIAVDETGATFVADAKVGALLRVTRDGQSVIVVEHLKRPGGVALDRERRLIVVEAGRGRILRLETDGGVTALASGIRHPRWVAAAPDGHLYVTAKNLGFEDEDDDEDEGEPEMVVRVSPDGTAKVFADGFRGLQGVTVGEDVLVVAAGGRKHERHARGALYEISIQPDGRAGPVHPLATNQFVSPAGLAIDRLGAGLVSARSLPDRPWDRHVIVKVAQDGTATLFAEGLVDPRGLAFGPDGSLYLAAGNSGRVLRFVAPRVPRLEEAPPALTNQSRVTLRFNAEAGARVAVLGGQFPVSAAAGGAGSAAVSVPLHRNAENHLLAFATGRDGLGLTSAPLLLSITQDEEPPTIELLAPRAGTLVRGTIAAEARAADMNGVADVEFRLDELMVGLDAAEPFRVGVDTRVVADGLRVLSARARDRAGNIGRASALVTVDNTPPAVRIVAPTSGTVVNGRVEVVVEAADVTAGVAQVELAVNGVSRFVAEAPPYRFQLDLRGLGPGTTVLVAAAVDRAGNRGESPPISVIVAGVTVEIGEPGDGARVAAGLVLVRGRVESGGAEVGVVVNGSPAAVQGNTFAALVPVAPDTTTLTAVATTSTRVTASHSVAIMVSGTSAATLLASPRSGVAPLSVAFSLLGAPAGGVSVDFDGNGTVDFTGPTLDGQSFTYTQPGLYFPTATVTDTRGNRFTANTLVQVHDVAALDTRLQGKWRAMKDALRAGDIARAVTHIVADSRGDYEAAFRVIAGRLPNVDTILTDVRLVEVRNDSAIYEATRTDRGVVKSFEVRFALDDDGVWRIEAF